uniref:Uncharacterized protein n=1 Tax=viral metagenome TaxID=1070528 RepID=A0A6M3KA68_9ZZZZ
MVDSSKFDEVFGELDLEEHKRLEMPEVFVVGSPNNGEEVQERVWKQPKRGGVKKPPSSLSGSGFRTAHQRYKRRDKGAVEFSTFGEYAADKHSARFLFESHSEMKQRWAVCACVLLRDAGVCRVCGEQVDINSAPLARLVVLLGPRDENRFSELSCVLVCHNCAICWYEKNWFLYGKTSAAWITMQYKIMRRRLHRYKKCQTLNDESFEFYKQVKDKYAFAQEDMRKARNRLVGELKRKHISDKDLLAALKKFGTEKVQTDEELFASASRLQEEQEDEGVH